MNKKYYIDGIDLYARYGVVITDGGYNDLLAFPALKKPETNDWPEEDGVEVDLESPMLEAKEVVISFCACNPGIDVGEFIACISQPGYHTLRIVELDKEWRLRLTTQTANKVYPNAGAFSMKFADDFPDRTAVYAPASGSGTRLPVSEYELDGIPFSRYGIEVVGGWDDLLKSPAIKQNLSRSISTLDGRIYDADQVVYSSKEVMFKCCLNAANMSKFWECYIAFFNDLIQPDERQLYWDYTSEEYPCHYKKSSDFKVITLSGQVLIDFSLTLVFTVFRIGEAEYVLANELGQILVLDEDIEIDMQSI